ncbi:transposase [Klebsiella pneumoniae]
MPAWRKHRNHKLEKLCRYITRPAIQRQRRLSISPRRVGCGISSKTPWRNGTTHVEMGCGGLHRQAGGMIPPPRAHLTPLPRRIRPECKLRAQLTPSGRGKAATARRCGASGRRRPRRAAAEQAPCDELAQRLKQVFSIPTSPPAPTAAARYGSSPASGTHRHPRHPRPLREHGALERTTGPQRCPRRAA